MTDTQEKLVCSLAFSAIASAILNIMALPLPGITGWKTFVGIMIFFFIISTLYGDQETNITQNWPTWIKKAKDIIGGTIGIILIIVGFVLVLGGFGLLMND